MFLFLKLIHIAAVIVFLGNIITGLFWHAHALRTTQASNLAMVMDGINRSDRWFTWPGVLVIIGSGVWLSMLAGLPLLGTPWIRTSLALFAFSGVIFGWQVAPLQNRLLALAHVGIESGGLDRIAYQKLTNTWEFWGAMALLSPLGALCLMVLKRGI